ncbi:MAG: SRPBCC domain-containing protein [Candidatus Acidiferrales bacterium]
MTTQVQETIHNTFVIERKYSVPVEKVFAAFADPATKRRWYAEGKSHEVRSFTMDFRVGGEEKTTYLFGPNTPFPGVALGNNGRFEDIVPNKRIVETSTMTLGEHRISTSLTTIELVPSAKGTDMIFTHQGTFYENSGGPKMREEGWMSIFDRLDKELAK